MTSWLRATIVTAGTVGSSVLTFWIWLRLFPVSWQVREYAAIAFWTIPLAAIVVALCHFPRRWLRHRHPLLRIVVAPFLGFASAITWTLIAYPLSGGALEYFDVHPTLCWLVAGTTGALISLLWRDMRRPVQDLIGAT